MQPYEIFLLVSLEPVDSAFLDQLAVKDSVHHVVHVVFNIRHQRLKMFVQFTKLGCGLTVLRARLNSPSLSFSNP